MSLGKHDRNRRLPRTSPTLINPEQTLLSPMRCGIESPRIRDNFPHRQQSPPATTFPRVINWIEPVTCSEVLTYEDEEGDETAAPPSLEAMHQKAQQVAAQHAASQGHHPGGSGAQSIEELDELIRKKEEEIRKGESLSLKFIQEIKYTVE